MADYKSNETLENIKKRRSIRFFTEKPVENEDIITILDAANQAPSAHNKQSWKFIVVTGEKKNELAELVNSSAARFPKPSSTLLRMAARSISSAPVVVAIANTRELIEHGTDLFKVEKEMAYDFFRIMEIQSSAAAVENMLLAATSLGLSTVWLGILILMKNEVLKFLGEPEGEFMAVVPIGYAVREGRSPKKQNLDATVRYVE